MNLNLLLIITAVILLCMVVDGYKKGMVRSLISLISLLITCVVLFLLGNALSSYFDGRFFNVIITLLLLAAIGLVHHLLNVVFFSAKVISKLPIVHSLDKLLGIGVGILETVLIVWTIYAFDIFRDLGTLGHSQTSVPLLSFSPIYSPTVVGSTSYNPVKVLINIRPASAP